MRSMFPLRSCKDSDSLSLLITISLVILLSITLTSTEISAKKIATLSGDQVVPPVNTKATGHATFKHPDSTTMNYKVNITGIIHPTGIGVHTGKMGSNGDMNSRPYETGKESVNRCWYDCKWKSYRTGSDRSNEGKNYFRACRFNEKWRYLLKCRY